MSCLILHAASLSMQRRACSHISCGGVIKLDITSSWVKHHPCRDRCIKPAAGSKPCGRAGNTASGAAAIRTLEEARANLAAIQAFTQRPTSLPGSSRAPRPPSSGGRSRTAPRFTLDEAAAILKSLPAVPEGEAQGAPPHADDGLVRRPAGIDRFLTDLQQLPPSAQRTAAEDQDYRRTVARRLQDQALAALIARSPKRNGAYPSLQPSSQDSMVRSAVLCGRPAAPSSR